MDFCNDRDVTSYGVIMCYIDKDSVKYCIVKRRDTIEYISILRAFYELCNLPIYVQYLTYQEKQNLLTMTFDELWNDLWINHDCWAYINTYNVCKTRYSCIESQLKDLITNLPVNHIENQSRLWEFPKGRKLKKESKQTTYQNICCALREYTEETLLPINISNIISTNPCIEIVQGTDGVQYQNVYYLAVTHMLPNNRQFSRLESTEIAEVQWKTYQQLRSIVDKNKYNFMNGVNTRIHNYLRSVK